MSKRCRRSTRRIPNSVEPGWRDFFEALGDDPESVEKTAKGASWKRAAMAADPAQDELINALDGDWPATEKAIAEKLQGQGGAAAQPGVEAPTEESIHRATRDSVRALMMIRAYRMRGHLHANLDPLGLEPRRDHEELHPGTYGFDESRLRPQDLHRQRARPRIRDHARNAGDPAPHLLRHDRLRVHAHLRPGREGLDSGAHRGAGQGDPVHPRRQARDPLQARRGRRLREFHRRQISRRQALRPRRRARR